MTCIWQKELPRTQGFVSLTNDIWLTNTLIECRDHVSCPVDISCPTAMLYKLRHVVRSRPHFGTTEIILGSHCIDKLLLTHFIDTYLNVNTMFCSNDSVYETDYTIFIGEMFNVIFNCTKCYSYYILQAFGVAGATACSAIRTHGPRLPYHSNGQPVLPVGPAGCRLASPMPAVRFICKYRNESISHTCSLCGVDLSLKLYDASNTIIILDTHTRDTYRIMQSFILAMCENQATACSCCRVCILVLSGPPYETLVVLPQIVFDCIVVRPYCDGLVSNCIDDIYFNERRKKIMCHTRNTYYPYFFQVYATDLRVVGPVCRHIVFYVESPDNDYTCSRWYCYDQTRSGLSVYPSARVYTPLHMMSLHICPYADLICYMCQDLKRRYICIKYYICRFRPLSQYRVITTVECSGIPYFIWLNYSAPQVIFSYYGIFTGGALVLNTLSSIFTIFLYGPTLRLIGPITVIYSASHGNMTYFDRFTDSVYVLDMLSTILTIYLYGPTLKAIGFVTVTPKLCITCINCECSIYYSVKNSIRQCRPVTTYSEFDVGPSMDIARARPDNSCMHGNVSSSVRQTTGHLIRCSYNGLVTSPLVVRLIKSGCAFLSAGHDLILVIILFSFSVQYFSLYKRYCTLVFLNFYQYVDFYMRSYPLSGTHCVVLMILDKMTLYKICICVIRMMMLCIICINFVDLTEHLILCTWES